MNIETKSQSIAGVLPILQTPFGADGEIDKECLQREVDWAYQLDIDGLCVAMVSEVLRMSFDERVRMSHWLVEMTRGRGVSIVSVGAETTAQAVQLARAAVEAGCDAIMAIPPLTTALGDDALLGYFAELAEQVDLPLIVQDASSYVGNPLSLDLCAKLLEQYGPEKVLFKPEAAPVGPNLSALRNRTGGLARIFDGSGGMLLIDAFRRGIAGTMPGVELLDGIVAMWQALQAGDDARAYRLYFPICAMVVLQMQAGLDGFLAIEKHILVRRGIFDSAARRRPYAWDLDAETRDEVDRLLDQLLVELES